MPITYEIDQGGGVIIVTATGELTDQELEVFRNLDEARRWIGLDGVA